MKETGPRCQTWGHSRVLTGGSVLLPGVFNPIYENTHTHTQARTPTIVHISYEKEHIARHSAKPRMLQTASRHITAAQLLALRELRRETKVRGGSDYKET